MLFFLRHWTATLIVIVLAGWGLFYFPETPSFAVIRLKQAIDARSGDDAARYIDFQKVVQNAGTEMVRDQATSPDNGSNLLGQLIGRAAVDLFSGPMAALLRQWAVQQVNDGAKQVQMPTVAVLGALVLLHSDGSDAYTRWTDNKGQVWEIRMTREGEGWKVTEVKNIRQLLAKLQRHEEKEFNLPPPYMSPPATPPSGSGGSPPSY